ncbi:MAG: FISUMP domain-containing protein [Saprospiraceae bacterium]
MKKDQYFHFGLAMLIVYIFFMSCNLDRIDNAGPFQCGQTIVDPRDGKSYKTIWIADDGSHNLSMPGKCWLAENLNFNTSNAFSNCYNEANVRCDTFGRMYNSLALASACLNGWHLATTTEWSDLFKTYGWTEIITGNGPIYSGDSLAFLPGGLSKMNFLMGGSCFPGPEACSDIGNSIGFWASDKFHNTFFNKSGSSSVFAIQFAENDQRYYIRCVKN